MSTVRTHIGDTTKGVGGIVVIDERHDMRWKEAVEAHTSGGPRGNDVIYLLSQGPRRVIPGRLFLGENRATRCGRLVEYRLDLEHWRTEARAVYRCAEPDLSNEVANLRAQAQALIDEAKRLISKAEQIGVSAP